MKKIMSAVPEEKFRAPLPIKGAKYPEENFIKFQVTQDKKLINLQTYRYAPQKGDNKGVLIFFHGLNSHQQLAAHFAKGISEIGVTVVGYDYRGFGKSEGRRGYIESVDSHMSDAEQFVEMIMKLYPNVPLFISGCSLGGMTSFMLGLRNSKRYRGVIFLAPAIKDNEDYQKFGKVIIKVMAFLRPTMGLVAQKLGNSSRNPEVMELEKKDPYRYQGKILPGTINALLVGMKSCTQKYQYFDVPFLTIQGGMDKLVDEDGSRLLMQHSPQKDKQMIYIDHMWHNVMLEPEIEEIIPQVCKWISDRL